jgi:hypothetical protein
MLFSDPDGVAIGADLSMHAYLAGFTGKGIIFHKLNAADPTQYVELVDIFTLPTDNSEGYGLFMQAVGYPNDGSKSVLVNVIGGEWSGLAAEFGNRVERWVDLSRAIGNVTSPGSFGRGVMGLVDAQVDAGVEQHITSNN